MSKCHCVIDSLPYADAYIWEGDGDIAVELRLTAVTTGYR